MVQGVRIEAGEIICVDPSTGEQVATVKAPTAADVDAAVNAAAKAQPSWAALTTDQRVEALKAGIAELAKIKYGCIC